MQEISPKEGEGGYSRGGPNFEVTLYMYNIVRDCLGGIYVL